LLPTKSFPQWANVKTIEELTQQSVI
jgi:hypothetical protein